MSNELIDKLIDRVSNAESILEILINQPNTNPEWASKKAVEHFNKYRKENVLEAEKSFKVISGNELINMKLPTDGITMDVKGNYIVFYNPKGHEFYHIDKRTCLTREERYDWMAHMSSKRWCDPYKLKKVMLKAFSKWGI